MPYQVKTIKLLKGKFKVIYECVDDHTDFKYAFWSNKQDIAFEQELMDISDIITTTSISLYLQKVSIEGRNNVYLSRNAVNEFDFISDNNDVPLDLINIPEPRIIYSGAIYDWFDKELFYNIVKSNKDKSFVIIGFGNEEILNERYDNLYILGHKKHSELKQYLSNCQIGIIPFKDSKDLIINCDPIKQYEYIACGLPVITTNMPETIIKKINTYNANNVEKFNFYIDFCLNNKIDKKEITQFLIENSWNERAVLICNLLKEVDYNNKSQSTIMDIRNSLNKKEVKEIAHFQILNAISFAKEDKKIFLFEAEKAYLNLKINFIEKWYVYALIINNDIKKAKEIILESKFVDEKYKLQLIYYKEESNDYINILKYSIRLYFDIYELYLENDNKLKLADYYYEYGSYEEAFNFYNEKNSIDKIIKQPLSLKNYIELLRYNNEIYKSETYNFEYMKISDESFNTKTINKWNIIFNQKNNKCPVCKSEKINNYLLRADGNYILRCSKCGLTFLERFPDSENINKIYNNNYYESSKILGYKIYNEEYNRKIMLEKLNWIENTILLKEKNILDIGCADGKFLVYASQFGWNGKGIEISDYGYNKAKNEGIDVYKKELRKLNIKSEQFECITLWDVVEHYIDPMLELKEIYRVLKKNGKLYISTPNNLKGIREGENWIGYNSSYEHLLYFEPDTLINILKKIGFKIDECFSYETNDINISNVKNIGHVLLISCRK